MANETGMKSYEELRFTDDFLFCKILQNDPELCRELTELILGREIGEIVQLNRQHEFEWWVSGTGEENNDKDGEYDG